jgi:transposase
MIEMEKQRFIDTLVTGDTKNIDEFEKAQGDRNDQIKDEIVKISNRCRENIRECISEVVSALRFSILEEIAVDDDKKKTNPMG